MGGIREAEFLVAGVSGDDVGELRNPTRNQLASLALDDWASHFVSDPVKGIVP